MSRPYTSIKPGTKAEGDFTEFVRVGRVRNVSFGESVKSPTVRVGEKSKWQVRYFPKGFTNPDWASIYVTSIDCELKGSNLAISNITKMNEQINNILLTCPSQESTTKIQQEPQSTNSLQ